ncbi:MAG: hypothetical protein ABSD89_14630 [Halobacteriota archaeon]
MISETIDAMADRSSASKNAAQVTRRKAGTIRKAKNEQGAPAPSARQAMEAQAEAQAGTPTKIGDLPVRSHLEKGISELQGLHEVLLSDDLDPRVLADFRDALNRVRTAAWAAQQYVARKEIDQDSTSVLSFLAGERIRAAYHLCQAISEDLKRTDIAVPAGSLIQLCEVMSALTEQLKGTVNKLG